MKIILVDPNVSQESNIKTRSVPSLGLAYLLSSLINEGYDALAIDGKFTGKSNSIIIREIIKAKPDVLGLSAMSPDIRQAELIAKYIKSIFPNTTIIVGGVHVLAVKERVLEECADFDLAVFGEGELVLPRILKEIEKQKDADFSQNEGVIYRQDKKILRNENNAWIKNVDALPFPYWEGFPPSTDYAVMLSRGCPYQCIFCMRALGSTLRKRSPEGIVEELERDIEKFNAKYFQFQDETFGFDLQWTYALLDLMNKKGIGKRARWAANSRVDIAKFEIYKMMRDAGCDHLGFGIESGNQHILDIIKKGILLEKAVSSINIAKKVGIMTSTFFIFGHPEETHRTIWDTIRFASKLNSTEVAFGLMVPYPGTIIYEMAKKEMHGYRLLSEDWSLYTKYSGGVLEVGNVKSRQLKLYQIISYLYFYGSNGRWRDFINFFWNKIKNQYLFSIIIQRLKLI